MEIDMLEHRHVHAEFDRYPRLLADLETEFDCAEIESVAERFIDAEQADFAWDGRFAEQNLGALESLDEPETGAQRVAILGYFRGQYYAAIVIVDEDREPVALLRMQEFESLKASESAFLASS